MRNSRSKNDSPLNHVKASDVDGASKYNIALLSTKRSAAQTSGEFLLSNHDIDNVPFPCTMLAGCGSVCIRRTAHRSTCELGSCPSVVSRHKTSKSLHRTPIKDRGVSSGDKHSTCTVDASPFESMTSKETVALRTTLVSWRGPSMISRLIESRSERVTHGDRGLTDEVAREDWEIYPEFSIATAPAFASIQPRASLRSCWSPTKISQRGHDRGDLLRIRRWAGNT